MYSENKSHLQMQDTGVHQRNSGLNNYVKYLEILLCVQTYQGFIREPRTVLGSYEALFPSPLQDS